MKSIISFSGVIFLSLFTFLNCKSDPKNKSDSQATAEPPKEIGIKVVTKGMDFVCLDTIQSGWNKFIYENKSTEPHFILFDKYPEGKTIDDALKEVIPPFDEGMAFIIENNGDAAMEAFGKIPEWYGGVTQTGGTGLISPGLTAISTVSLDPGYYVIECYVKMPNGQFHASMGMMKELIVLEDKSILSAPEATIEITISSTDGITFSGTPSSGNNLFSVSFTDQVVHEHFMGHDVNLVRLEEGADLVALENWMNWATPDGLKSSSLPAGFKFLGGANDAPGGTIHYFEANLEQGDYVLIAEVPNPGSKGMLKTFSVGE